MWCKANCKWEQYAICCYMQHRSQPANKVDEVATAAICQCQVKSSNNGSLEIHIPHYAYEIYQNQRRTFLDLWKCHIFVHANLLNPNNVTVVDGWSLFLYENERVRNNKFVSFYKPFSRSSTSLLTSDFSETFWRRSLPRSVLNKWSLGFREAKDVISTIEIIWKQCT